MSKISDSAIKNVRNATMAFCKFVTPNDVGATGGHQCGYHVGKSAETILFSEPGQKGKNLERTVKIEWQDDFTTESHFKYYGVGTRNEYRITSFGRGFPYLKDDNIGDLLVLAKYTEDDYKAYDLNSEDEIEDFLSYFNISPEETNKLIETSPAISADEKLLIQFQEFMSQYHEFPPTRTMSAGARKCYNNVYNIKEKDIVTRPDEVLLNWIDTEYKLFRSFEEKLYGYVLQKPFSDFKTFLNTALGILNSRKSRAGKSLEHHLAEVFNINKLIFEEQAITEDKKRPDFLFPDSKAYHDLQFPANDLIVLGAKTTCKDRWRQVLTEANRIDIKYLFTLQQGISSNQLKEMEDSNLKLVVPKSYISCYPTQYRNHISNLAQFINMVQEKQQHLPKSYLIK